MSEKTKLVIYISLCILGAVILTTLNYYLIREFRFYSRSALPAIPAMVTLVLGYMCYIFVDEYRDDVYFSSWGKYPAPEPFSFDQPYFYIPDFSMPIYPRLIFPYDICFVDGVNQLSIDEAISRMEYNCKIIRENCYQTALLEFERLYNQRISKQHNS